MMIVRGDAFWKSQIGMAIPKDKRTAIQNAMIIFSGYFCNDAIEDIPFENRKAIFDWIFEEYEDFKSVEKEIRVVARLENVRLDHLAYFEDVMEMVRLIKEG